LQIKIHDILLPQLATSNGSGGANRPTKARAVSAASRQPQSMVSACPRQRAPLPGSPGDHRGELDSRGQAKLGQDVGDVELDGAPRGEHAASDLGIGQALCECAGLGPGHLLWNSAMKAIALARYFGLTVEEMFDDQDL
jgi:hypothetical protein